MSPSNSRPTIAVVGASFAGLSLARALQHHYDDRFRVCVLELRAGDVGSEVNGSLCLRHAAATMRCLGLDSLWASLRDPAGAGLTNQRALLRGLVASLRPGTVRYGTRVRSLREERGRFVVECVPETTVGDEGAAEPYEEAFDCVVGADGLTSPTRGMAQLLPAPARCPYLLVGDAARVYGRELWFGLMRYRYGGSQALAGGLQLGRALGERGLGAAAGLAPFGLAAWRRRRRANTALLLVPALLLVLVLLRAAVRGPAGAGCGGSSDGDCGL